ncbi:hypothetical protein C0991_007042 [Blastosporella zonata]|nr:hypothetical protein C0991_007041 [Blastosporella zonata]KAG6862993.1 hypothetical protein C0991_008936 [Blastosporella zonata]KAG6863149.1 hypothetical protein C0991_007917 [Blastosporella zonata]KAG6863276.1 hypothetical protein C0991_007042 [Blastosporella zonata]
MADTDLPPFHGDKQDESPRDFINRIKKFFMFGRGRDESDMDKIDYFSFSLKDGGVAAAWFEGLAPEKKDTWTNLMIAFDERWPATQAATKTLSERQEELAEIKLREEELGTKVTVAGADVHAHVAWADRVERAAKAIPDNDNLLVRQSRSNMPPSLKALVPASRATWKTFCDAVRAVNMADLREEMEERKRTSKLEEEVRQLRTIAAAPPAPTKALTVALGTSTPTPAFMIPRVNNAAPVMQPRPAQQNTQQQRSDAEKWTLIQQLPQPEAISDASRARYHAAVNQWHAINLRAYAATEDRPYPLTPGTAPLGSRECTGCGRVGHLENNCTATTRIPQIESRWRRKVDSIKRAANTPTIAVSLVDAFESLSIAPHDLRAIVDAYLAEKDAQGKGEGPSE